MAHATTAAFSLRTIDKLGPGVAGRMEAERAGGGWHGGHCGYCDSCRRGSQQASLANTPPV